jgi:hypothetical protein
MNWCLIAEKYVHEGMPQTAAQSRSGWGIKAESMVPETGIEPVRPLSGKRRILSPLCLPISPLGRHTPNACARVKKKRTKRFFGKLEAGVGIEPASTALQAAA